MWSTWSVAGLLLALVVGAGPALADPVCVNNDGSVSVSNECGGGEVGVSYDPERRVLTVCVGVCRDIPVHVGLSPPRGPEADGTWVTAAGLLLP